MSNMLTLNLDIPRKYQDMLYVVQQVFPSAIIAGGSLRDLHYDKPVKDVDIFILNEKDSAIKLGIESLEELLGSAIEVDDSGKYDNMEGQENIRLVNTVAKYSIDGTSYDVIFLDTTLVSLSNEPGTLVFNTVASFDFSICQIGFDGKDTFITPEYLDTYRHKVVHVINFQDKKFAKRLSRLKVKFPDFTVKGIPNEHAYDVV